MKSDDIPDIHDTDARDFEEWLGQAEWDEDCRREEKWESGDTITIGDARKKLGMRRERFPSGEE